MNTIRVPGNGEAARIDALATLPVFHRLRGRDVALAGAGEAALWKAELLAAAGARLTVFLATATPPPTFRALRQRIARQGTEDFVTIRLEARRWQPGDLAGCALAVGEFDDEDEAVAFATAARAAGVPVNVIDKPALCDFQFGAIVNRSPLIVSISTDGAAPVFGQAIRARIETLLPRVLGDWAQAAMAWRCAVQARKPGFHARRRFWERFAERALAARHAPDPADHKQLLAALEPDLAKPAIGSVTLVGAGPGAADLLTIRAVRALQSADIILYDDLVSPDVLELARREAKRMLVGKKGHGPSCRQADINVLIVKLARQGRRVVRLKGGDPLIFGRATEEIDACRAAGLTVDIVPGISAAQGAAASLGLSLTERGIARRVQYLTGHGENGALPPDINWPAIVDPAATSVLYMPRHTLATFVTRALAEGLSPDTPAAAITNATRADESTLDAPISDLPALLDARLPDGPTLVMIGAILRRRGAHLDTPAIEKENLPIQSEELWNFFPNRVGTTEAA